MRHNRAIVIFFAFALTSISAASAEIADLCRSEVANEFFSRYRSEELRGTVFSLRAIGTGQELLAAHGDEMMIPASVLKLLTTYAALKELKGEYQFLTEFLFYPAPDSVLVVRGFGDPTMTEERLYEVVDDLARAGIGSIKKVVLDSSAFRAERKRTGINPYQAANTALPLNFNSVNVRGQVVGAKKVFSTTSFYRSPIMAKLAVGDTPSVVFSDDASTVQMTLPKNGVPVEDNYAVEEPEDFFGQVFLGILKMRGVAIPSAVLSSGQGLNSGQGLISGQVASSGKAPEREPSLRIVAKSKELANVLADMNRYSSNFLAEQIAYQLGRDSTGSFFDYERGLAKIAALYKSLGAGSVALADASGLSKENRITASGVTKLIAESVRDREIGPDFEASLSRFGRRGTLKKRSLQGPSKVNGEETIWAKTGTVDGVSAIAGTVELRDKTAAAFAIITNGASKTESIDRENSLLRAFLRCGLSSPSSRERSR